MFGKTNDTPTAPAAPVTPYVGVTYESHVEEFYAHANAAKVAARLGELGAQGWEPVAIIDKPLGFGRGGGGKETYHVILKRRAVDNYYHPGV